MRKRGVEKVAVHAPTNTTRRPCGPVFAVVADVVADPSIQVSRSPITATTTRRVSIRGSGFDLNGVIVQLEPTWASAFEVEQVFADEIVRSRRLEVLPSHHASPPGMMEVGGFSCDFE